MQTHPFDILSLENGAQLIFTPCPGIKEAMLSDAISTLKQAGTSMLISLMFDEEMKKITRSHYQLNVKNKALSGFNSLF